MTKQNKGRKFEGRVQRTIASGALWFDKGDLKAEDESIECKYTDKAGFRISLDMLEKLWGESLTAQKEPRLVIGIKRNETEVFVVTASIRIERK